MEVLIFAYRLLGLPLNTYSYRAGLLVHMLYSHEIWLPLHFQNTKPFLTTAGVNSKFSAALTSSPQIFTDVISLKEKQMECIWKITCLEEDVLVVFPTGFDKRHDSESDKIVSPHWVVVSPLEYTWRQQVENLMDTHWRIELVLSFPWIFFKRKYLTTNEEELFFLFSATSKHSRQKI